MAEVIYLIRTHVYALLGWGVFASYSNSVTGYEYPLKLSPEGQFGRGDGSYPHDGYWFGNPEHSTTGSGDGYGTGNEDGNGWSAVKYYGDV